jgi:hypothetical protein
MILSGVVTVTVAFMAAGAAWACGGGLVTRAGGTAAVDAQRIFISVGATSTEVVTMVRVPAAQDDFGVLLPVPALPTLDPEPVPAAEMDQLVAVTNPRLFVSQPSGDDDGGCGCVPTADKASGSAPRGPELGPPVTIGPVTAVVLDASSADALTGWLTTNAFTVPPQHQSLIAAWSGPGRAFIALRRSAGAAAPGATSVGVHFTLPGDQRDLPLRFARLGASDPVSFTVFVAAPTGVATGLPFETFALAALDASLWRTQGYDAALLAAVGTRANHAFVVERRAPVSALALDSALGPRLSALTPATHTLTRLSTRVPVAALDSDVSFSVPAVGDAQNSIVVAGAVTTTRGGGRGGFLGGKWGLAALAWAAVIAWRLRRRSGAPAFA